MSPTSKRRAARHAMEQHSMSERAACRLVGLPRSTQRRALVVADDEPELVKCLQRLSAAHPRYGYRRIHRLLLGEGWRVNHKRVQRLWRREGFKVPRKARKRRARAQSGNSCALRKAESKNHVWSYDFLFERTEDGRQAKVLVLVDEFTREALYLDASRSIRSKDVIEALACVMADRGVPRFIRSDNGPEFVARAVQEWLGKLGAETLFIQPGSPWENAYSESFNSRLRDELLNGEIFTGLAELSYVLRSWRRDYNDVRPHSGIGYMTPSAFAARCGPSGSASLRLQAHTSADSCAASKPTTPHLTELA